MRTCQVEQRVNVVEVGWTRAAFAALAIFMCCATSLAQVGPDGIDWVTVGAVGNQPWQGNGTPGDRAVGRGGVNYEYKIGRFEVTTAQWVEFMNAAYDRPRADWLPHLANPSTWGAVGTTPNTPGGRRWAVPAGNEMLGVGGISWHQAAIYCNWLENNKSTDRAAFLNGAYDVSTFFTIGNIFQDQAAHTPGARYWIPTWDEWLKASHFDPNFTNPDGCRGKWWQYSTTSDTAPLPGPPGVGEHNRGFSTPSPFGIPLGSYTNVTSPWGLYDTAGGTSEWTEEIHALSDGTRSRYADGSWWLDGPGVADRIGVPGIDEFPNYALFDSGFRIASTVPSPNVLLPLLGVVLLQGGRTRCRRFTCSRIDCRC